MNPFIEEFNHKNNVSPDELKSRFRKLSKKKHPDLGGSDSAFIELQQQYHEAREYFQKHNRDTGEPAVDSAVYRLQAREALFQYLRHYKILELPYAIARREDPRYEKIWQEVRFWAGWYDPPFKELIEEYHRLFSHEFKVEDRYFIIARQHFEKAFVQFLNFQLSGIKPQARICLSYIHDARTYLGRGKNSPHHSALRKLLIYFKETLTG